jgi:hypothetical protein
MRVNRGQADITIDVCQVAPCGHVCAAVRVRACARLAARRAVIACGSWLGLRGACMGGGAHVRARGSLRSGRGGRRVASLRSYCPHAGTRPARTLAGRASPARTDARWASVPALGDPPPSPYLRYRDWGDPEGSCAGAPLRAWPQQWRLRFLDSRRLKPRRLGLWCMVPRRRGGRRGASRAGGAAEERAPPLKLKRYLDVAEVVRLVYGDPP